MTCTYYRPKSQPPKPQLSEQSFNSHHGHRLFGNIQLSTATGSEYVQHTYICAKFKFENKTLTHSKLFQLLKFCLRAQILGAHNNVNVNESLQHQQVNGNP